MDRLDGAIDNPKVSYTWNKSSFEREAKPVTGLGKVNNMFLSLLYEARKILVAGKRGNKRVPFVGSVGRVLIVGSHFS